MLAMINEFRNEEGLASPRQHNPPITVHAIGRVYCFEWAVPDLCFEWAIPNLCLEISYRFQTLYHRKIQD